MRRVSDGMPRFRAGLIAIVVVVLGTYLAFTKDNPFSSERQVSAVFRSSNLLAERSPVRIAGVDVGKVVRVERYEPGGQLIGNQPGNQGTFSERIER